MTLHCLFLATVASLLSLFDQKQDVASANQFFQQLDHEQFTDSKIQFTNDVPVDSCSNRYGTGLRNGSMPSRTMSKQSSMR